MLVVVEAMFDTNERLSKGSFTYYVINRGGGGFQMFTVDYRGGGGR